MAAGLLGEGPQAVRRSEGGEGGKARDPVRSALRSIEAPEDIVPVVPSSYGSLRNADVDPQQAAGRGVGDRVHQRAGTFRPDPCQVADQHIEDHLAPLLGQAQQQLHRFRSDRARRPE